MPRKRKDIKSFSEDTSSSPETIKDIATTGVRKKGANLHSKVANVDSDESQPFVAATDGAERQEAPGFAVPAAPSKDPFRLMVVKIELKAGANSPRATAFEYDQVTHRLIGVGTPVPLVGGIGTFRAKPGRLYLLYWGYDGLTGSNIQTTVYYPPPENTGPGVLGPQASQSKSDPMPPNLGTNSGFMRVPDKGLIL